LTYFNLNSGNSTVYRIRLNATYEGRFYLPAVHCSAMYDDEINALEPGKWVEVIQP
jgi:alpha-2-macroglobulin